jgi:hypothetical protein
MVYKLTNAGTIFRLADQATIPVDAQNRDYQDYQAWVALGNTPQTADPPALIYTTDIPVNAKVRTTDATPTVLYRATLRAMTGYDVSLQVIAVDQGNGVIRKIKADATFKRLGAGAVQVGATTVTVNHADTGFPTVPTITASGNDLVITVAGAAGRTIDWSLRASVSSFTPDGV